MSETLILHHYDASPYAEKIRLMFGAKGLRWQSLLSPPQPPRPNVDPLSGGYRRIPIGQIGADVFCDTFVIAQEVARLADAPEFDPESATGEAAELAARAEGDVFFSAIGSVSPLTLLGTLVRSVGPFGMVRFALDRAQMMQGAKVKAPQGEKAKKILRDFLGDLDRHLAEREFLAGETPTIADFAAFHPLWLHVSTRRAPLEARHANVLRWYARLEALGHGQREEIEAEQAFEAARSSKPRPLPAPVGETDPRLGRRVSIAPTDYGTVETTGTLVAATPSRLVLARETDRFGTLHVHFPQRGFSATEA